MIWFLRRFRQFRELEAECAASADRRTFLEANIINHKKEAASLRDQLREMTDRFAQAQRSEIESTRRMVDSFARRHGGPVFDIASDIPVRPDDYEPIPRQKPQAADLVEQMDKEFAEAIRVRDAKFARTQ